MLVTIVMALKDRLLSLDESIGVGVDRTHRQGKVDAHNRRHGNGDGGDGVGRGGQRTVLGLIM